MKYNTKSIKKLSIFYNRSYGRNYSGKITSFHKGGGHKKIYRIVDFNRKKFDITSTIQRIDYDPYRTAKIALINYKDGEKKYILAPEGVKRGDSIISGENVALSIGNTLLLKNIPVGEIVHNVEINPKQGGKVARSGGSFCRIMGKDKNYVILKLPTGEIKLFNHNCLATIGKVLKNKTKNLYKAGNSRHLGIRPTVRGSAMNAVDHPHGGGEGKSPIGLKHPKTPWGKPALGIKTRSLKKLSNIYIIKKKK